MGARGGGRTAARPPARSLSSARPGTPAGAGPDAPDKKQAILDALGIYPAENQLPPGRSTADKFAAMLAKRFLHRRRPGGDSPTTPSPSSAASPRAEAATLPRTSTTTGSSPSTKPPPKTDRPSRGSGQPIIAELPGSTPADRPPDSAFAGQTLLRVAGEKFLETPDERKRRRRREKAEAEAWAEAEALALAEAEARVEAEALVLAEARAKAEALVLAEARAGAEALVLAEARAEAEALALAQAGEGFRKLGSGRRRKGSLQHDGSLGRWPPPPPPRDEGVYATMPLPSLPARGGGGGSARGPAYRWLPEPAPSVSPLPGHALEAAHAAVARAGSATVPDAAGSRHSVGHVTDWLTQSTDAAPTTATTTATTTTTTTTTTNNNSKAIQRAAASGGIGFPSRQHSHASMSSRSRTLSLSTSSASSRSGRSSLRSLAAPSDCESGPAVASAVPGSVPWPVVGPPSCDPVVDGLGTIGEDAGPPPSKLSPAAAPTATSTFDDGDDDDDDDDLVRKDSDEGEMLPDTLDELLAAIDERTATVAAATTGMDAAREKSYYQHSNYSMGLLQAEIALAEDESGLRGCGRDGEGSVDGGSIFDAPELTAYLDSDSAYGE